MSILSSGRFFRIAAIACVVFLASFQSAIGQTDWIDPLGGGYFLTNNWSPADIPNTAGETAQFNIPNTYNVSFFAGDNVTINALFVFDGDVTFVAPGAATYNPNDVAVAGGNLTLFETAAFGHVDLNADQMEIFEGSTLTFDGGSQSTSNSLKLGNFTSNTPGNVSIVNGSALELLTAADLLLGLQTTGTSTMLVDGTGSSLTTAFGAQLFVGSSGKGFMDVLDGASVSAMNNSVLVGFGTGTHNSRLTIDGGSTFDTYDPIGETNGITRIGRSTNFSGGILEVLGGSNFVAGDFIADYISQVTVDGPGTSMSTTRFVVLDRTNMVISGGAVVDARGFGGGSVDGTSKLTVTGAGSRFIGVDTISLNSSSANNPAGIHILNGGAWEADDSLGPDILEVIVTTTAGAVAEIVVDGAGSLMDTGVDGQLSFEGFGGGVAKLDVTGGGSVITRQINAALSATTAAHIRIESGTVRTLTDAQFGARISAGILTDGGTAIVDLLPGGLLHVGGTLRLGSGATINLFGGELLVQGFDRIEAINPTFKWNNGTVRINDSSTLSPAASAILLPSGTLGFGQELRINEELTLQSTLTVDGGTLSLLGLVNSQLLQLKSGRFEFLDDNLIIGAGGPLGEEFELLDGMTLFSDNDVIVEGVLIAGGRVDSGLSTSSTGEIRVEQGKRLHAATSLFNAGSLQLQGGRVDVGTNLTNAATGNIMGRGTLAVGTTLTNQGDLALSNGQTDVFGDVNNTGAGRVLISGNAEVTFWDDVTHTGAVFNVSTGSSVTFFGTAGFGITGDLGEVFFEADITPGSSPGLETFEGNVHFGIASELQIELAGTDKGSEYDALEIDHAASLSGGLSVALLSGFTPALGDTFDILTATDGVTGVFSTESFPDLGPLLALQTFYDTNTVTLAVVPGLPGDYNADGIVNAADYTTWRDALGQTGTGLAADGDLSGTIDAGDYTLWKTNFGMTAAAASLVADPTWQAVPEPETWIILVILFLGAFGIRRWVL